MIPPVTNTENTTITRRLAPEDIVPGMYIAIAARYHEVFPFWLIGCIPGASVEPFRYACLTCAEGEPRRVLAVCLPFVLAENAQDSVETIDVRMCSLVRVDEMYALEMFTRPDPDRCSCCE